MVQYYFLDCCVRVTNVQRRRTPLSPIGIRSGGDISYRANYRSKKGAVQKGAAQSSFLSIWAAPLDCAFGLRT